jgi:hypothetical protein
LTLNATQINGRETAAEMPTTRYQYIRKLYDEFVNLQIIGKIHQPLKATESPVCGKSDMFNANNEDKKDSGNYVICSQKLKTKTRWLII